jgi:hypothetical protein
VVRAHENARRLEESKPPGAIKFRVVRAVLEHAKHDRANKGECDIRGNNAQSVDESHGETSLVHVAARCNAGG